jgi:hypothetical protein
MVKKKTNKREGSGVKIIGSKSIDYTFLDNDLLNLKSATIISIGHKIDEHYNNNVTLKAQI